jgi:hypothetical protein
MQLVVRKGGLFELRFWLVLVNDRLIELLFLHFLWSWTIQ